jgi:DNA primase
MARIRKEDVDRLKKNVSMETVCRERGIELKKHGTRDLIGKCPFHDDEEPSFIVTPDKNLFHCLGCDAGGSVIDLVMKLDGLDFRQAVDKLMTSTGVIHRGGPPRPPTTTTEAELPEEKFQQLLEKVIAVYEKTFPDVPEGKDYIESRGIDDAGLISRHRIGYCNGRLNDILPGSGDVRDELKAAGVLLKNGRERFTGCVVVPVFDVDGNVVTLYGRYTSDGHKRHVYLSGRKTGLWNVAAIKTYSEIILVESVLDALSVEVAGYSNVVSIQNTNGLSPDDVQLFQEYGVQKLILLLDGDDPGQKAAARLKQKLTQFTVQTVTLSGNHDPNSFLQEYGATKLAEFIQQNTVSAEPEQPTSQRAGGQDIVQASPDGFTVSYGLRKYEIRGVEKSPRKIKATVRVEYTGKLHVDTLDFYSARSRRILAQDLCRLFDETPETIEADLTRLVVECEKFKPQPKNEQPALPETHISPRDKQEAESFGRSADIIDRILADYETCGLVGEESNKLLSYLAAISRKTDEPISVLILSSSGAGKTALQDTALSFVPPEDLVKLTSLTGKALFYKERLSLKHKVLSLEEGDGAEEASYAIRNLISAGELVIESAIKDSMTGKIVTMTNRVEGPTTVFITTTDPETDPETKSRFFITSIDESREQTRKILTFQRQRQTLDGMSGNLAVDAVLKRHRNFQRLLKPLTVVNPFAKDLTYGDDRLQGRRDQPKYLNLIKAVAFLRQMTKPIRTARKKTGEPFDYIEIDADDIRIANKLAHEILGHSLEELSRPSRDLLIHLEQMVERRIEAASKENKEHKPNKASIIFSRREIREFTGWANARVHRYLKELIELEYVIQETGRNGSVCRYRLAWEGQGKDGAKFMLGLKDIAELLKRRKKPDK